MQSIKQTIAQEAADWFVRHRGGLCSSELRAEFAAWLRSSPLHVEEYLRTAVASRDLQAAARSVQTSVDVILEGDPTPTDRVVVPLSSIQRSNSSRPRFLWPTFAAAAAAAIVIAVAAGIWLQRDGQRFGLPKAYRTAHAEQRSWLLPDGSSLSLDSDTSVVVSFNNRERLVRLERGEALFQVAHEAERRFRVSAGDAGVIAIGTEFDVVRAPSSTRVTVVEGKVAVFTGDVPQVSAHAALPLQATSLNAGEQISIDDHSQPSKPALINVQRAVAWVHHQIAFEQQPLGEVTDEFNHYSGIPIVIENERVRGIRISGVFDAYDTDSFVKFISRLDNVHVEERADRIIVSDSSK